MELCGLHTSSNGHARVQEWHNEACAAFLPQKRKRSDFLNLNGDRSECANAFPAKETDRNHSKCSSLMHSTRNHLPSFYVQILQQVLVHVWRSLLLPGATLQFNILIVSCCCYVSNVYLISSYFFFLSYVSLRTLKTLRFCLYTCFLRFMEAYRRL